MLHLNMDKMDKNSPGFKTHAFNLEAIKEMQGMDFRKDHFGIKIDRGSDPLIEGIPIEKLPFTEMRNVK